MDEKVGIDTGISINKDCVKEENNMTPIVLNKLENKGLNEAKKTILKQLMGSYSGKIDFNKVRDEWKKDEKS
ncbi:MAG: hypothetical protein WA131_04385 [Desulfitobacteriaceae bacterium]